MIRRPPRSTLDRSSAASDVYKRQDKDWLEFEKRFVVLNPSFSSKLLEKSLNKLTITEIKICSLIKTGLNTQEVANVLFLSKRTVENHRYHIQKKLDLVDLKLEAFLITL